jgi:hypothetical protein
MKTKKRKPDCAPPLLPPAKLVSKLLRLRERKGLDSFVAPEEQPEQTDVWGLCSEYVATDFDAMDDDVNRNAAYTRAFAAVPHGQTDWLEIGCGASATLTRLAVRHGPARTHVTAFEVNAESAAAAAAAMHTEGHEFRSRANFITGRSTEPPVERTDLHGSRGRRFHVLLHEVFGVVASSEGCPHMLDHACASYLARPTSMRRSTMALCHSFKPWLAAPSQSLPQCATRAIPSRAATFFTPCELSSASLDGCENLYSSSAVEPKVLLVPCAPLDELGLSATCAALEMYRFGHGARLSDVEARVATFEMSRDGILDCLGVFIWVDLGLGGPSPSQGTEARESPAASGALPSVYPFGDTSLEGAVADSEGDSEGGMGGAPRLNDFTSLCTGHTRRARTHATNWMNPLLLLPTPTRVRAGDTLRVCSSVRANSTRPSYDFELTLYRRADVGGEHAGGRKDGRRVAPETIGTLHVGFEDLYPDYGDL